jgi:hypothetical protein
MNNSQPSNTGVTRFAVLFDGDAYCQDKEAPCSEQIMRKKESEYGEGRPVKEEYPDQKQEGP